MWGVAADGTTAVVVDQQSLLEEEDRLDALHRSYDGEARLNESFIVLTIGASLIASLGVLANNAAVVIGAMVVAPWILPLRVAVFAVLIGQARLLSRSLITLAAGAGITLLLSMGLGLIARSQGLLLAEALPEQVTARLEPNILDLGIALAAGAVATYAKVNPGAVSSMAGTAIAVALVPPVCVMGLMLSAQDLSGAQGAALLYAANLLGILIGGISVLAIREPYFREKLRRRRRSRLPVLLAVGLAVLVGQKLYERYERHLFKLKQEAAKEQIESDIRYYLKNETLTFGANEALELEKIVFDWPNYWEQNQAPTLQVVVRVTDPTTPSYKQVQEIQDNINSKLSWQFQGLELQMQVQRINVSVVQGNEVDESLFDLEQIFNEADTALAPMQVDEEELEDPSEAEICSEPNC
ncbi:DUF389 domain-containing protein [Synechococcus sp. MU1650]|uniref:DUF389 domain-containing protein n=1 Tax=Synechococcus sp. MU1650 TaxID=2508352 RepID=UPI001CF898F9|nr:DUF389 domain-containing protein [Synechococcus sp. MU1650]MCB4377905.1 DUF389 domain-containing protein [Synechococcus sp. MU1650]MCB4411909.1 DUF389 domain-containing protein [Synechococcus sp. MU1611]